MHDFEQELRERLRDAAEEAPRFTAPPAVSTTSRRRGWMRRGPLAAAAAVVVAASAGIAWWATGSGDTSGGVGSATCAAILEFDGHTYLGHGFPVRVPRTDQNLGTGTMPDCADTPVDTVEPDVHVRVRRIPGVDPHTAVFADEAVWIRKSIGTMPQELRDLFRPVACTRPSTIRGTMTGEVLNGGGLMEGSHHVELPYTARFVADHGSTLPLQRYSQVEIPVRVTAETKGGDDVALTRAVLWDGAPAALTVKCDGPHFVATAIHRRTPP